MAFTTSRPNFYATMPTVSESGIDMLYDLTARKIWSDDVIQYGWGGGNALGFDSEFKQLFQQMYGRGAALDKQFAFYRQADRAFEMIDNVTALDFEQTTKLKDVDLILTSTNDRPHNPTEGFFEFPGNMHHGRNNESWAFGSFNSGLGVMKARPELGGGQYANWTILHEIGHSLGLKHTHQEVNGIPALPSVGRFMNNERYSVMSYNGASDGRAFGHAVSMMALDVASLQALYGKEDFALGNSEYTLMNAKGGALSLAEGDVQIGRAYYCIWDSDGAYDNIDYAGGKKSVLINLNDATLDTSGNSDELMELFAQLKETSFFSMMSKGLRDGILDEWHNAGGFFSQVLDYKKGKFQGTDGGFSIAHGAEIETADGGNGHDLLIGNEQGNSINGNNGDDTILGGAGEDRLDGGSGSDWVDGGSGDDIVWGGSGRDRFVFADGYDTDVIADFETTDVIDLEGLSTGVSSVEELLETYAHEDGDDVVIEVGSDVLIIRNTNIGDLNEDNVFV